MPDLQNKYDETVTDEMVLDGCEAQGYSRRDAEKLIPRLVEATSELYRPKPGTLRLPQEGPRPRPALNGEGLSKTNDGMSSPGLGRADSAGTYPPAIEHQSNSSDFSSGEIGKCSVCNEELPLKPGADGFLRCASCFEKQLREDKI